MLRPVISRLFPSCDAETRKYITMNVSANLLGLGNAATPMAISQQIDMLHGPLLKKLLTFALPLAASGLLQMLFNSADAATAVLSFFREFFPCRICTIQ